METVLYTIFVICVLVSGLVGRLANEESTPRKNALAANWLLEPELLTDIGKQYRRAFLLNLSVMALVFLWIVILSEQA